MPTPRTRQSSNFTPWPHLSLLSVYSAIPIIEEEESISKHSDEQLEAAKILYFCSPSHKREDGNDLTPERKRRLMGTVMGVADFAKMMTPSGKDNKVRSVKSSKRRMVWIEPENGIFVHATIAIPRTSKRHSRQASTATTSSSRSFPSDSPPIPLDDQLLLTSLELASQSYQLQYGRVKEKLEKKGKEETMRDLKRFWDEWSEKWDVTSYVDAQRSIQQVMRGLPMSPLLTPQTIAQLSPLLDQFSASNPTILPILLHNSHLLHFPNLDSSSADSNSPNLSPSTLSALAHHLLSLSSLRTSSALSTELTDSTLVPPPPDISSNWTSSALSYLDPRNVPISSISSSFLSTFNSTSSSPELRKDFSQFRKLESQHRRGESSTSEASEGGLRSKKEVRAKKEKEKEEGEGSASGTWGLRSVSKSWTKLIAGGDRTGVTADATKTTPTTRLVTPTVDSGSLGSTYPPQPLSAQTPAIEPDPVQPTTIELPKPDLEEPMETEEGPITPAVELAPEVDEEELKEAMKGIDLGGGENEVVGESAEVVTGEVDTRNTEEKLEKAKDGEEERILRFFGNEDEPFEVRLVERGSLTLALASRPLSGPSMAATDQELLYTRADRLVEAVESVLDSAQSPATAPSSLIKHESLLYSRLSFSDVGKGNSSDTDSSKEAELETTSAFLDAHHALNSSPQILESLTRLPTSSTWISFIRSFPLLPSSPTEVSEKQVEVFAILPSKNSKGRETSLVEAAEGARRIERKWVAQRGGA